MTANSITPELKNCPFCGTPPTVKDHRLVWTISCDPCQIIFEGDRAPEPIGEMTDKYWDGFYQSAVTKWNRRA